MRGCIVLVVVLGTATGFYIGWLIGGYIRWYLGV